MKSVILRRAWSCWFITLLVWAMALVGLSACSAGTGATQSTPIAQEATRTPSPAPTATVSPTPCPVVPSVTPEANATASAVATATRLPTSTPRTATELHLAVKDTAGQAVSIAKAELILVGHIDIGRLELETNGDQLVLMLDEAWLRSQLMNFSFIDTRLAPSIENMECVYLYIQADDYAPIRSAPFLWIGADGRGGRRGVDAGPRRVSQARIGFPNGSEIVLPEGSQKEFTLSMRKPQARYLRFVDDDGAPVPNLRVSSYVYWSELGHCGVLVGDQLAEGTSDAQGRVRVPDGDCEYAIEFEESPYVLKKYDYPSDPRMLITYLEQEETVITLHRWQRRSLEMQVTKAGKPLAGQLLYGWDVICPCMACYTQLALTDQDGWIRLPDFYPEEWEHLFFASSEDDPLNQMRDIDHKLWPQTGVIHIEL